MRGRWVWLAALVALVACGGPGRRTVHDLVAELPLAVARHEVAVVDTGLPEARPHLVTGWYQDETTPEGTSFVWSRGPSPTLRFYLQKPRDLEASIRCRPLVAPGEPRQTVRPILNGRPLPTIELRGGFATYRLRLPSAALETGDNVLKLAARFAVSPRRLGLSGDWRDLAVAVDWVRLTEGPDVAPPSADPSARVLVLPARSEVAYHLRGETGLRLSLDRVEAVDGTDVALECLAVTDEDGEVARATVRPRRAPFHLAVPVPPGRPLRLVLRAVPTGDEGGTLRLEGPRLEARRGGGPVDSEATAPARRPRTVNVVLYLVDALRADRLGAYGCRRPTSPALDAFAGRATLFAHAYAQSSWTRPAVATLLTGLRPEVHGVNTRRDRLGDEVPYLPEVLQAAGYETAAVVANPNVGAELGFGRGFGTFQLLPWDRRRSEELNREAEAWLDRRDPGRPFLLYLHTVDPHLPYDPPAEERARFAPRAAGPDLGSTAMVGTLAARELEDEGRFAEPLRDLYDAEVAANDRSFGRLLAALEKRSLLADTMVVFVADHGEEFHEHGGWIHGRTLYEEVLHIPLVIELPGQRDPRRVAAAVGEMDLVPTILEVLGLPPLAGLDGRSLLGDLPEDRPIPAFLDVDEWRAVGVVRGGLAALRHCRLGGCTEQELYDLTADPGETQDLGGRWPVRAATLISEARAAVLARRGRYHAGGVELSPEMRRHLQALGYVSDGP